MSLSHQTRNRGGHTRRQPGQALPGAPTPPPTASSAPRLSYCRPPPRADTPRWCGRLETGNGAPLPSTAPALSRDLCFEKVVVSTAFLEGALRPVVANLVLAMPFLKAEAAMVQDRRISAISAGDLISLIRWVRILKKNIGFASCL